IGGVEALLVMIAHSVDVDAEARGRTESNEGTQLLSADRCLPRPEHDLERFQEKFGHHGTNSQIEHLRVVYQLRQASMMELLVQDVLLFLGELHTQRFAHGVEPVPKDGGACEA